MNRINSQEEIINLIKMKYYEKGNITKEDVYKLLIDYGYSNEDKQVRVKKHRFGLKSDIIDKNIILAENFNFFPFNYGAEDKNITRQDMVKMYIPVDAKNLKNVYYGLKKFIRDNKILSINEARNRATNDDIVLRVFNSKDVFNIKSFINNNPEIKNSIKNTNPFIVQDELGIGYSVDGNYSSVNEVLASALCNYVTNNPTTANRDGFKEYLNNEKTEYYLKEHTLYNDQYDERIRIKNLIGMTMDEDLNYVDVLNYFNMIKLNKNTLSNINYKDVSEMIHKSIINKNEFNETVRIMNDIEKANKNEFDNEAVYYLCKAFFNNDLLRASILNNDNLKGKKFS